MVGWRTFAALRRRVGLAPDQTLARSLVHQDNSGGILRPVSPDNDLEYPFMSVVS